MNDKRKTDSATIQLYYAPDNASLIVRMVLEELKINYATILVDRSKQDQQSEAYKKLNPNGLIPVCVIHGEPVFETAAILLALADTQKRLIPVVGDTTRPQCLKWLFYLSNTAHTNLRQLFYPQQYVGENLKAQSVFRTFTEKRFNANLRILEAHCASQNASPYMMGKSLSVCDFYIAVLLRWAQLYPQGQPALNNLTLYPALQTLADSVSQLDSVKWACEKEGIYPHYFNKPTYVQPKEGSAT